MILRRTSVLLALVVSAWAITAWAVTAAAQPYPSKPVKVVVPYPAGTATDLYARQVTGKVAEVLGQQIVIDNRGGAGGIIGTEIVAKSPNDGYTMVLAGSQSHAVNYSLYKNLPYDPINDFTPVARLGSQPLVWVVTPGLPIKSIAELVDYAKKNPGKLNYASSGSGTSAHLAGEMLRSMAGVDIVHVPYKSAAQAITDLMTGEISMMAYPYLPFAPHMDAGKMRALATTGPTRSTWQPNLPTMVESGYPDFVLAAWFGVYMPKDTPRPIVEVMANAFLKAIADPLLAAAMNQTGTDVWPGGPDELASFTKSEIERYRKIILLSGAKVD